jgi:hypothetical protein
VTAMMVVAPRDINHSISFNSNSNWTLVPRFFGCGPASVGTVDDVDK